MSQMGYSSNNGVKLNGFHKPMYNTHTIMNMSKFSKGS